MSHEEVMEMMGEMRLPYAYDHFVEGEAPEPPFAVFLYPAAAHFAADGKVYHKARQLQIEVYADLKSPEMEERVEAVLEGHGIFYVKSEIWIPTENLYEVLYQMEV